MMFYILTRTAAANIFLEVHRRCVWKISKLFKINDASWPIPYDRILGDMNIRKPLNYLFFLIQKQ